ncbi:hypothetical protein ACFOWB_06235 [Chenggangzhangella methanolivorans]|uniref:hypothetical protein n=1 Tax=Chenggangzhangella methanolivorans TaxID=1437009 RepID=UPI003610A456
MSKLFAALAVSASLLMVGPSVAGSALGAAQLGAAVDLDGALINGIGVDSVVRANGGAKDGQWAVKFKRDLTGCVWTGSIGYGRFRGFFPPNFITVSGLFGTTDTLYVETFNGKSRKEQDAPFTLIVICG